MQKPKIRTLRFGFGENLDLRIIEAMTDRLNMIRNMT